MLNNESVRRRSLISQASQDDDLEPVPARAPACDMSVQSLDETLAVPAPKGTISLLMLLYVMQGVPLGLTASVSYLLQYRGIKYSDQALFSLCNWPFSLKLCWAPVVDSVYCVGFGRRKSWLVPVQYLIGAVMIILSYYVNDVMPAGQNQVDLTSRMIILTAVFVLLNFLAATQDIAVDGWALTMLPRSSISWAATCNAVGQTAGYFLGIIFLVFESPQFCNKFLRSQPQPEGLITLSDFLLFWGTLYMITTTLVMLFKREKSLASARHSLSKAPEPGVDKAYQQVLKIIQLPSVQCLCLVLLTIKIGYVPAEAITSLKLIEAGVPKENLALLSIPLIPVEMVLPLVIARYTRGYRPMELYIRSLPYRMVMGLGFVAVVGLANVCRDKAGHVPGYFYVLLIIVFLLQQVPATCMFVSIMAYFSEISDPVAGGTYMTLLNTVSNLGTAIPTTVALWLVDLLSWYGCNDSQGNCVESPPEACRDGWCYLVDGYYLLAVFSFVIGVAWIKNKLAADVSQLQNLSSNDWIVQ